MAGGYDVTPVEPLDVLREELRGVKARLSELERPTGTQLQPLPVAASGGNYSQFSLSGSTGVVWADNSGFASVDIVIPTSASGAVLVYMTANVMVNEAAAVSASGTTTAYVSFNAVGGTSGSTSDALIVETSLGLSESKANIRVRSTAINLVTLSAGAHTLRLAAAYEHSGTSTGATTINSMSIAAQVLS